MFVFKNKSSEVDRTLKLCIVKETKKGKKNLSGERKKIFFF